MPHDKLGLKGYRCLKATYVENTSKKSYSIAAVGDWILWDAQLTIIVMTDEQYKRLMQQVSKLSAEK